MAIDTLGADLRQLNRLFAGGVVGTQSTATSKPSSTSARSTPRSSRIGSACRREGRWAEHSSACRCSAHETIDNTDVNL